jgi:hemoglobin-like flavoprotein
MSLDVRLLQSSFELVTRSEPELAARFYDNLFTRYPQTRPLFADVPMDRQQQMLTEALAAVVTHLEDGAWLDSTLRILGRRHAQYGITPQMYDWVGDALLTTLAQIAGPKWTDELAGAWADAYGAVAGLMQQGALNAA